MNFHSVKVLGNEGFVGFKTIGDLTHDCSCVPAERGVYFVLYLHNNRPQFVIKGSGGFFKGKNPNVAFKTLEASWVDKAIVIYIGQTGGLQGGRWSNQTLNERIKQLLRFGEGKNVSHYGGRYIWQIENHKNHMVCWKVLPCKDKDPKKIEINMIRSFVNVYGMLPFANLRK